MLFLQNFYLNDFFCLKREKKVLVYLKSPADFKLFSFSRNFG